MIDIQDVKRLELKEGETLVIQCKGVISNQTCDRIRDACAEGFPGLKDRLMVIDDSISLAIVSKVQ